jgi:hypothetical protein
MITIVRVSDKQKENTYRCYCGRAGKGQEGLLGNPFAANVDHSNRDEVCDKYQIYFDFQLECNNPVLISKLNELVEIAKIQDIELACFCQSPKDAVKKKCHTETIKAYIEQQLDEAEEDIHILNQAREIELSTY